MSFLMLGSLLSMVYVLACNYLLPGEISTVTYLCGYAVCYALAYLLASRQERPTGDRIVMTVLATAVPLGGLALSIWGCLALFSTPPVPGPDTAEIPFTSSFDSMLPVLCILTGVLMVAVTLYKARSGMKR